MLKKVLSLLLLLVATAACSQRTPDHGDVDPLLLQTLTDESKPSQLLVRKGYVASYNKDTRLANWVAWTLTADHTQGNVPRPKNAFHADCSVPAPRADWGDYRGTGWVRGHLCPAGDNKWDEQAMYDTFLMTNIVPQDRNLNDGDWNELENLCRKWARRYGRVYIVSGPLPYRRPWQTISSHRIVVPRALFKVVMRYDGKTAHAIAFVYKNQAQDNPKSHYVNSLDQVERLTGIEFFPNLPADVKAQAARTASLDDWEGLGR